MAAVLAGEAERTNIDVFVGNNHRVYGNREIQSRPGGLNQEALNGDEGQSRVAGRSRRIEQTRPLFSGKTRAGNQNTPAA